MGFGDVGYLGFGSSRRLELPGGDGAGVSGDGRAALRFSQTAGQLQVSLDGGAYVQVQTGSGVSSPWLDDGAGNVRLQTLTNDVVVGAAAPPGAEKLYVTGGDVLLDGDTVIEANAFTVQQAAADVLLSVDATGNRIDLGRTTGTKLSTVVPPNDATALTAGDGTDVLFAADTTTGAKELTLGSTNVLVSTGNQTQLGAASIGAETVRVGTSNSSTDPALLVQPDAAHTGDIVLVNNSAGSFAFAVDEDLNTYTRMQQLFDVGFSPTPVSAAWGVLFNNGGTLYFDNGGGPQAIVVDGGGITLTQINFGYNVVAAFSMIRNTGTGSPRTYMQVDTVIGASAMRFGDHTEPLQFLFNLNNANTAAFQVRNSSGSVFFNIDTSFNVIQLGNQTTNPQVRFFGDGPLRIGTTGDNNYISVQERAAGTHPSTDANQLQIYGLDAATVTSLWVQNSNGDQVNLTKVPTITGSRGGNAALTSLLSELATMGFIVDSTTA